MARTHNVNGIKVPFSSEEEAARDIEEATWEAEAPARNLETVQKNRFSAYQAESDPLFFKEQAGEIDAGTWSAKRAEIKIRLPKP
tara:strand:+ start:331 stop:585 length:255 start_codon:yes stop_codon:yes gene_type:complete